MALPRIVFFDLDGTLAQSKSALEPAMAKTLTRLLEHTNVAIISGGAFTQFKTQVVDQLPADAHLERLFLLPTSGGALYRHEQNAWKKVYEERIPEQDAEKIGNCLETAAKETHVVDHGPVWGPRLEQRGAQVTFSALGQKAPVEAKRLWDPDKRKRKLLREAALKCLPKGYVAAMGGSTTIDVTRDGIDKAYGIHKLTQLLGIDEADTLYIGDELVPGGNDEAVYKTNTQVHPVGAPSDTERVIVSLLAK